jgi:hypothetical protein
MSCNARGRQRGWRRRWAPLRGSCRQRWSSRGLDWGWGWAAFLVDYDGTRATAATASSLTADCRRQVKPQHQISAKWSSRASNSISGPEARRCYCSSYKVQEVGAQSRQGQDSECSDAVSKQECVGTWELMITDACSSVQAGAWCRGRRWALWLTLVLLAGRFERLDWRARD